MIQLILASSSKYRQELLARLGVKFISYAPDCDETPAANETVAETVRRLAGEKARKVAQKFPGELIVGADQLAAINLNQPDQQILGKPHDYATAYRYLETLSGKTVYFLAGVALYDAYHDYLQTQMVLSTCQMRSLSARQISAYLEYEQPWDVAGALKTESSGICLIQEINTPDPNALLGLPLIQLVNMLDKLGLKLQNILN